MSTDTHMTNRTAGSRRSSAPRRADRPSGDHRSRSEPARYHSPMAEEPDESFDLEAAAASLRADGSDVRILLKSLVAQLSDALGTGLTVERAGGRFRKSDEVKAVQIVIGDDVLRAELDGSAVRCTISHASGGITIRTERVGMNEWTTRLLQALRTEAAHSDGVRRALEHIVIGGDQ